MLAKQRQTVKKFEVVVSGGVETVLSALRNTDFGPVLTLGLGGVGVELFRDVAHLALPASPEQVHEALARLKLWKLLQGFRGSLPADIDAFVNAVGTPKDTAWDERIWNVQIDVHGNLASAWMEYAFLVGDRFSHCGVNHFQFSRSAEGNWEAIALADTRQRECDQNHPGMEESAVETALRNYLKAHATGNGDYHRNVFNPRVGQ